MPATGQLKRCVKCQKDVTHDKRMKDSQGKYWCIACGTEDQKRKHSSKVACTECRGMFAPTEVETVDGAIVCVRCLAVRGHPGAAAMSEQAAEERKRKLKLALALTTFAAGISLIVLFYLEVI
ncbi:MAG: hypothetical protein ACK4PI_05440 [Tepidisphaerales bacterium]